MGETPMPPTDPRRAVDLGQFGVIDPHTKLFRSYDSGTQYVGTQLYPS
jgi:hypothetical protein